MKSISEILDLSATFLKERGVERSKRIVEDLLAFALKMKRMDLYMQFDRLVTEEEMALQRAMLKRAVFKEPIEYITGQVEFLGCKLQVDSRVLIPRQETEILAAIIAKEAKSGVLWDICCGSGCLGISIKTQSPELEVTLSDICPDALAVAKANAKGLDVTIVQGDLLEPFQGKKADFVVCNPPYVTEEEYLELDPSVKNFEPRKALVGGVSFYQRLADELPAYLNPKAKVFLEIGHTQADRVKEIFNSPIWARMEVKEDWSGKSRFFFLEKQ